jgi:hypothetical protein
MKKFLFVLLVFVLLPFQAAFSQALVFDAALDALTTTSVVQDIAQYIQQVFEWIEEGERWASQVQHYYRQVESMIEQSKRAMQNLETANDIKSWSDFMDFYNRQLYLERSAMESFDKMSVQIGNKTYKLTDIEGMAHGFDETYSDKWNKEFTEEQRRKMWYKMGLTPANYAFVQPFREKAREIAIQGLTSVEVQNEWYMRNMERNNERLQKIEADALKDTDDKMGQNEVMQMLLESSIESNKVLNDIAMFEAQQLELQAVNYYLDKTPQDAPLMSEWPVGFTPLEIKQ